MKLPKVYEFLKSLPHYNESGDGIQGNVRCPYCGDSTKSSSSTNMSIKVDVEKGEPLFYQCWRAECDAKGVLRTETIQQLGCMDMETIMELSAHNAKISKNLDKSFVTKKSRNYQVVNIANKVNIDKLKYINSRLGVKLTLPDLKDLKIQMSLYDMVRINDIKALSFGPRMCDLIDAYCIGFMSMYNDYLICRDITPKLATGRRYHMYRNSGKPSVEDMKLYSIPRDIDIMSPEAAVINVAEGPFSILGAYVNTDLGRERPNSIWFANCGSEYLNTIVHVCKQYGLLKVRINIWSDSEIKMKKYEKLLKDLQSRLDIEKFTVLYNEKAEDFGYPNDKIKVSKTTLYKRG